MDEWTTASELRRRARAKLFRKDGGTGYGTYLLGLLLQGLVIGAGVLLLVVLFGGACVGFYAALNGTATTEPTPALYAGSTLAAAVLVFGILYLVGFGAWGQRALALALMRDGLKTSHGLAGWGNGWRMVSLMLWQQTFVFLWLLVFVVPGIRAVFSYAMAPYLLVDHPDWEPRRCLAESKRMMEGHRWRFFCLNLSFIGWQLLVVLAACFSGGGILSFLLTPYVDGACAAFYEDLLDREERAPRAGFEGKMPCSRSALTRIPILVAAFSLALAAAALDVRTCGVKGDGVTDDAPAIQRAIDTHPNTTLHFPDGTYLLSRPIATPAHPRRSVDLQLANYAILKAAPGWTNDEAMVRLGGIHPANDIRTPGSIYSLTGGIIDGSGVAKGVSIDGGRETRVARVSMKNVARGLHIKRGANSGSSDCDINEVHIFGNGARGSIGVLVEGHDNHLTAMRIANVAIGVKLTGGGNLLRNVHPLLVGELRKEPFETTVGFLDRANDNCYSMCYSDQFCTAFDFGEGVPVLENCIAWWYAPDKGRPHIAIRCAKQFKALVTNLRIGFRNAEARNVVLQVGAPGGKGFLRDPRVNEKLINEPNPVFRNYLQGVCHP